ITLAKIGIEGVTIDEAVTSSRVLFRSVDTVRVDTVDRLPHAVLDHEAEYQSLDILVDADRDLQSDPCSGFYHLYGAALVIQQDYIGDTGFAGTRDGAYLVIGHSLLDDDTVLTLGEHGAVEIHYLLWRPSECHTAAGQQDGAVADALDRLAIVGDNQQGGPRLAELPDAVEALVLKVGVSHGKSLVDNQDIRAAGCGDAEGQAHLHAAGVGAHRLVDVLTDLREGDDVRHQRCEFVDRHAEQLPGHEHILSPGEFRVEAHAQLQQCGNAAGMMYLAGGRLGGACDHLQQGALARTVDPDDADGLARLDLEVDVL